MDHLEWGLREAGGRGALIVTDGVFSMDGDIAPLERIVELAHRYDARVMVDDAHGLGALGPGGRGSVAAVGLEDDVDIVVGTLGKSLGSYGAYACMSRTMSKYLINTARTLIFSTALSPPAVAAAGAALDLLIAEPRRVDRLQRNAKIMREALTGHGMATGDSTTQVLPLVVGAADDAVRVCERALEKGIFAQAIRPPTVPEGSSRLRLAVMASHTRTELQEAARVLADAMRAIVGDRPKPIPVDAMREPERGRIFDGLAEAA
jgi:glycine C-acetyltransferase/8-amino-7-oxononanoate synthase